VQRTTSAGSRLSRRCFARQGVRAIVCWEVCILFPFVCGAAGAPHALFSECKQTRPKQGGSVHSVDYIHNYIRSWNRITSLCGGGGCGCG